MADYQIEGFHAHLYFTDDAQRTHAMRLRDEIARDFPGATLGRVHEAIGPHPVPMYQVAFPNELFGSFVPWLMLRRGELRILVHPLVGDPLPEHRDLPLWMGEPVALRLEVFEAMTPGS